MPDPTRDEMVEALRLPDEHSQHTFGALVSYLISQAFDRVATLNPEETHRYYTQCKLCGGTDELRDHYKTSTLTVKHGGACSLAAHLERLRALAAHPEILREFEAGGWRPIAYRVPVERHIAIAERDEGRWAIFDGACCLNNYGEWEVEPSPSNRSDAFKMRTRYSLKEAMRVAAKHFNLPAPPATSDGGE